MTWCDTPGFGVVTVIPSTWSRASLPFGVVIFLVYVQFAVPLPRWFSVGFGRPSPPQVRSEFNIVGSFYSLFFLGFVLGPWEVALRFRQEALRRMYYK